MSDLITKLVPIVHVKDPGAERHLGPQSGLCTTYEHPECPGFIALGNDTVEFVILAEPATRAHVRQTRGSRMRMGEPSGRTRAWPRR